MIDLVARRAESRTSEYKAWLKMCERCVNPRSKDYPLYGGRGISVAPAWNVYAVFLRDMGRKPSPGHSIGRKDNDGPYCAENCEWQTATTQARNRRSNRMLTHGGLTLSLADWSERIGVRYGVLLHRVSRGWSPERVLTSPVRPWPKRRCA